MSDFFSRQRLSLGDDDDMSRPNSALIVDDEPHLRSYLKLIMKQIGFTRLHEASNGQAAIDDYKKIKPDLVLLDVNMPIKEGMEALKEIMEYDEEAVVIMASSVASREAVENSLRLGASHYIRKDTKKEEIVQILSHVIEEIWGEESTAEHE